ncbi:protoheme IX farnesyltransferase [Achlya hypogyna]|uniref:Protoheme IX farnesyltransferase, mitochondrial n=1 Tax=Achlya hypogyna TaxID=1202772 RepID=A0A1V9YBM6_ACHHY|nr:protoheme IX farnesyltransferase [Achlya hypogyna]
MLSLRRTSLVAPHLQRAHPRVFRILSLSTRTDSQLSSVATSTQVAAATSLTLSERVGVYSQLSKARLSSLVVVTAGAGFFMMGGPISWSSFAALAVGTTLASASANTFNQAYEIRTDGLMKRTMMRPLVQGVVSRNHALAFGAATAVSSTAILAAGCNPLTAGLSLFNIGLYSCIYTPMKQTSEWNTWIGALVGAIPPVMGVAAANGLMLSPEALLTGSALFMWQMPHFFALSWRLRHDYARGGYKMIPCADPTGARTAGVIMRYALGLTALPVAAAATGATSYMFAVEGLAINAYALNLARKFYANPTTANANKVFFCSLWYLPAVLGLMVFHSKNWTKDDEKVVQGERQADGSIYAILETDAAIEEESFKSLPVADRLKDFVLSTRAQLKEVCLHEYLWKSAEKNTPLKTDDSHLFCPVVATEAAADTAAAVQRLTK